MGKAIVDSYRPESFGYDFTVAKFNYSTHIILDLSVYKNRNRSSLTGSFFLQVRLIKLVRYLSAICPLKLLKKPRITQNGKNCKVAQTRMNKGFVASERKS